VVWSASVTWYEELLATMHTADVSGLDQVAQGVVGVDLAARAPGRAERDERRGRELELRPRPGEELDVLGVGAGPAALDVVDAEVVELGGDAQLVLDRRRDALDLQAVAQGGVEDLDHQRGDGGAGGGGRVVAHGGSCPEKSRSRPEGGFGVRADGSARTSK